MQWSILSFVSYIFEATELLLGGVQTLEDVSQHEGPEERSESLERAWKSPAQHRSDPAAGPWGRGLGPMFSARSAFGFSYLEGGKNLH